MTTAPDAVPTPGGRRVKPSEIAPQDCPEPYNHEVFRYCPCCSWISKDPPEKTVVHVTRADTEEYARIYNIGYADAMAQQVAPDPTTAGDWLADLLARARAEARERIAVAIEECLDDPAADPQPAGMAAGYASAARIARSFS